MKYEINTNQRQVLIKVYLGVRVPQRISLVGIDANPDHNNTIYFARSKGINGNEHLNPNNPIEIPMPLTPDKLILEIGQENGAFGSNFNVAKVEVEDLPKTTVAFPPNVLEYYNFIKTYCQQSNYRPVGFYNSKDENYLIWVKEHLDGDATPARVNRRTGVVKVNLQHFQPFTVFMKVFIMLHEFIHYNEQTTDETRCDLGALRIYLGMGFPKTEANYAMTKIFDNSPAALERVKILHNYIKNYDLKYTGKQKMPMRSAYN